MSSGTATRGGTLSGWVRDVSLGFRFAATGGREGWTRTALTTVGVGLGVALLLVAASVPAMLGARTDRGYERDYSWFNAPPKVSASTVLFAPADTAFRDDEIRGVLLKADGDRPALPPGVAKMPAPGEMVVSPALKKLLDQPGSKLLRERLHYRIIGLIGDQGLVGPAEMAYYAGSDKLVARSADGATGNATRIPYFGRGAAKPEPLGGVLSLLVIIIFVVLLLPVGVFIGSAVRFGGERRDRRLAALRLVGADSRMTRRVAAGEALFGSLLGLAVGAALFLGARQFATDVTLYDISVYPSDITPSLGFALLVALAVPAAAVAVTLLAMRGIAIEPLGVVRNATARPRRLWWRLLIPLAGLALLAPLFGAISTEAEVNAYQVTAGVVLLLVGLTALLPWVVESAVGRLRGGPVAWQLATRRIQLHSSASARMVSGVTAAVAGAIALQTLFSGVQSQFVTDSGKDPDRAQMVASVSIASGAEGHRVEQAFAATPGVRDALTILSSDAVPADSSTRKSTADLRFVPVVVADCATLRELVDLRDGCADGDVFLADDPHAVGDADTFVRPGRPIDLNVPRGEHYTGTPRLWTVPAGARKVTSIIAPDGDYESGVLATPAALDAASLHAPGVKVMLRTDPHTPDAFEQIRNTTARLDPSANVFPLESTTENSKFVNIRRGLLVGAAATLALIGASLLVSMLEQLRERRKLLAVLVAFGTRRSVLGLSVLWQTALPVALGMALAVLGGAGLGAALLKMVGEPLHLAWGSIATMSGIAAGVVLLVTLLAMPPLWRMMRPDGLRTE
ncbi:FtsX-like permease family protein [Actinacidiphila sp. bgisy167]|uniref:FtsX-like permease family protein n=1 Tax=Actinacidiphila sp. bgisy167 TaxID=3413797 RepID=UPI003D7605D4